MITTEELREMAESDHPLHGDLARVAKELLELRGKTWLSDVSKPTPTDHAVDPNEDAEISEIDALSWSKKRNLHIEGEQTMSDDTKLNDHAELRVLCELMRSPVKLKAVEDGRYPCPMCDGEGEVEAELVSDYRVGTAGLQVYGCSDDLTMTEKWVTGAPAMVLNVIEELDRLRDKETRWEAVFLKTSGHITTVCAERDALRAELDKRKTEHLEDVARCGEGDTEMTEQLKPCPFCGSAIAQIDALELKLCDSKTSLSRLINARHEIETEISAAFKKWQFLYAETKEIK